MCMLRNCKHAPAMYMDEVVVISSESSTESNGELPASTGSDHHQIWTAAGIIVQVCIHYYGHAQ